MKKQFFMLTIAGALALNSAFAATIVCTEDQNLGCTGTITVNLADVNNTTMTLTVSSDGESYFDPIGYGADTSDAINFSFNNGGITVTNFAGVPGWTSNVANGSGPIPSGSGPSWALPADLSSIGCGAENNTTCEPIGGWILNEPIAGIGNNTQAYLICEWGTTATDGVCTGTTDDDDDVGIPGVSDLIILYNDTASGNGVIGFQSDFEAPEPTTMALFGSGLVGLAIGARKRRKA